MGLGVGRVISGVGARPQVQRFVASSPTTSWLRTRFTNDGAGQAIARARALAEVGVLSTLHMREQPVQEQRDADSFVRQTVSLIDDLAGIPGADVAVKMEQLGYAVGGTDTARVNVERILERCSGTGTTVTLDMEHPCEVEDTLQVWGAVQRTFPDLGIAIQAYLPRSEQDCAQLASRGARVRLCKGGYRSSGDGSFESARDVDLSFVRCARHLMNGSGYPMIATHDRRLLDIVAFLARQTGRSGNDWEIQTLQGVAPDVVLHALEQGVRARCYLPFGSQTYPWLLRRVSERPRNLLLLAAPAAWSDPLAFTTPPDVAA